MTFQANTIPSVNMHDLERENLACYEDVIQNIGTVASWFAHNETETQAAEISIISEIQSTIRERLSFSQNALPWTSKESGNCYSFAWHTSLALEEADIRHYIAYTNGHAYCIAVGKQGDLYMVNTDQPAMNDFELPSTVFEWEAAQLLANGFEQPSIVTTLDTNILKAKQEQDIDRRRAAKKKPVAYPWIEADAPMTTIMQPEYGRLALYNYTQFSEALNVGDITQVDASISSLAMCNPQQETRDRHNDGVRTFKKFIKRELMNGSGISTVLPLIEKYCAIMPDTFSMRIHTGDLYRLIAGCEQASNEMAIRFASRAQKAYLSSVMPDKPIDSMRLGKISKCVEIVKRSQSSQSSEEVYV